MQYLLESLLVAGQDRTGQHQRRREALQRLVASVTRFLDPAAALAAAAEGLEFTESRPLGGPWELDGLWSRLGIAATCARAAGATSSGRKSAPDSAEAAAALSRQGRYKDVAGNLEVKEVRIAEDERFVICFNPGAAERDAAVRTRMIAQLEEAIRDSDQFTRDKRAELRGVISTKPGLNRYLRVTPGGLLRTDAAKAKAEENLDGKYLPCRPRSLARGSPGR